ncbi:SH3 domain-containing protein [Hirsutella rhossiliensis]
MSHASKNRLSQYSVGSVPSRSRPQSHAFPMFPSSLSYTLVRDFAYPASHPLHYGPPPEPSGPASGLTTPASENRRLSDPPASWEQRMPWDSWTADAFNRGNDIPPIHFGDGPPYSEDEDLQSPVVATRHRKHKSTLGTMSTGRPRTANDLDDRGPSLMDSSGYDNDRGYFIGRRGDGSEQYYVNEGGEADGPGGELVTYPPDRSRHSRVYHYAHRPPQAREQGGYTSDDSSCPSSPGCHDEDQSRYSRDYQFTITSPDEEFHGKAVALFDFERENENELPLVEGQIIWVSYRHGQGWLVAEDPKTQESGLVPEEYVRLLRDIEGGMNSLTGQVGEGPASPNEAGTPTQAEHGSQEGQRPSSTHATNGYHQPVVSIFSTSSKDLNPYPTEQLGIQAGQTPPQVIHYHGQRGGSQANTPTVSQHNEPGIARRESQDSGNKGEAGAMPVPNSKAAGPGCETQGTIETER